MPGNFPHIKYYTFTFVNNQDVYSCDYNFIVKMTNLLI